MQKFIRLDFKGEWRGKEHVSSMQGLGEDAAYFEEGISCYRFDDKTHALDNLARYWFDIASVTDSDLEEMQITIFEGELITQGSDHEDIATCENTLKEIDAKDIMLQVKELYILKEYDWEIEEDEYEEKLNSIELI